MSKDNRFPRLSGESAAQAVTIDGLDVVVSKSIDCPRIIVADDDPMMCDCLERLLSERYRVETVADGVAAMAAIDRQPPDLVLTDILMPNLNGLELLRSIRANPATQDLPMILLSAHGDEESRIAGLEAGADDYIIKPFSSRELVARVDATLRLVRLRLSARDRERALQQENDTVRAKLDRIVANINNGFATFDRQWRYTYVNNRLLEIFNLDRAEVLGKQAWEVFPHQVGIKFFDRLNRAMTERVEEQFEYYYDRLDCWVEHRVYPTDDGLAILMADVTERKRSELEYRTLFESIDEGFCIIEMLFDDQEQPVDYRFLQVNPAFFGLTGLPADALGKTMRELVPDLENFWMETYGKVVLTGEAVRFENYSAQMNRWFNVYATRVGDAANRRVAIVFDNITERKQAEKISQRAAKLDAFRIALADALRPLEGESYVQRSHPIEIQATASRILGEYLGANRVAYFEVRGTDYVVDRDYVNGATPISGRYSIDSFGVKLVQAYRSGCTVSVSNVSDDPYLSLAQRAAYTAIEIGAYIGIPLVKSGEFVAGLAVHVSQAREWTPDEITLCEEVAERTWSAIERARAEAEVAANLRDTQLLLELGAQLVSEDDINTLYREILATAIAITGADAGTVQMLDDRTQDLCFLASQGIESAIIEHFARVNVSSDTSCGRALRKGTRIFVDFDAPDIPDPDSSMRLHAEAGLLCAQSTPLISRTGKLIGMMSTHWRTRHQPSDSPKERLRQRESQLLDLLARQATDIIEQRQTTLALRDREAQLRLATGAAKVGMWFWNLETDTLTWTEQCKAIFGLAADAEMSYEIFLATLHPDDRQPTQAAVTRSMTERTDYNIEYRSCWPDGTVHWVAARGSCTYNLAGTPTQMLGVAIDITDRKRVEEALRVSEAQLAVELADMQQLQQISSQLISQDNIDALYQQILDAAISLMCADLGIVYMFYPDSNELRLLASRGLPSAAAEFWQCVNVDATNTAGGRAVTSCERIFVSDVETCDALVGTADLDFARLSGIRSVQSVPLISRNGRVVGTICTQWRTPHQPSARRLRLLDVLTRQVADLLDRQQAEIVLRTSQERLSIVQLAAKIGAWDWDVATSKIYWSPEYYRLYGIDPAVPATYENWLNSVLEVDRAAADRSMQTALAQRQSNFHLEFRVAHPTAGIRWFGAYGQIFYDGNGQTQRVSGISIDITDRKLAEITLAERAHELADLNSCLAQSEIRLQERNQELDSFVHIVSHDLKAPLRAVSNLSVWIEEDLEGTVSATTTEQMTLLRDRVQRMEGMIDGLLEYARVGLQDSQLELVSIADLVAEAIESIAPPPTFSIAIATDLPTFNAKRLLLSQVFANLISNAFKHHDKPNGCIQISSRDLGECYEFAVADDGPGILSEYRDRIFVIFQSVNAQTNPDSTGIGLSIVKKIVETAGGRIWLESELGQGTTFYFTWPNRSA